MLCIFFLFFFLLLLTETLPWRWPWFQFGLPYGRPCAFPFLVSRHHHVHASRHGLPACLHLHTNAYVCTESYISLFLSTGALSPPICLWLGWLPKSHLFSFSAARFSPHFVDPGPGCCYVSGSTWAERRPWERMKWERAGRGGCMGKWGWWVGGWVCFCLYPLARLSMVVLFSRRDSMMGWQCVTYALLWWSFDIAVAKP